jgi:Type IX secretion system protein PorV
MKTRQIIITSMVVLLLSVGQVWAESASTSGGIVLQQAVGARAQGMGETFTGIADDATALHWNVAGLSRNEGIQGTATYFMGLAESAYEQIMYAHSLGKAGSIGIGLIMLQGGIVSLDQADGSFVDVQSQSDIVVDLGYGTKLTKALGIGIGVKLLSSTLAEDASATAFALDLGVLLAVDKNLSVGLSLQNAGTEIKYKEVGDPMPTTVRLGAGYDVAIAKSHQATLGIDLIKANDRDFNIHTGVEYWYDQLIAVRVGYKAGYDLDGLTAGFGVQYRALQIDYALSLMQELNHTHKISFSVAL